MLKHSTKETRQTQENVKLNNFNYLKNSLCKPPNQLFNSSHTTLVNCCKLQHLTTLYHQLITWTFKANRFLKEDLKQKILGMPLRFKGDNISAEEKAERQPKEEAE